MVKLIKEDQTCTSKMILAFESFFTQINATIKVEEIDDGKEYVEDKETMLEK